jgi:hypothetical protein
MITTLKDFPSLFVHIRALQKESTGKKKANYLQQLEDVKEKLSYFPEDWIQAIKANSLYPFLAFLHLSPKEQIAKLKKDSNLKNDFLSFVDSLREIEDFYEPIGGILGYQYQVFKLLQPPDEYAAKNVTYKRPEGWDITGEVPEQIYNGLIALPLLGEVYPVGGAGDRLDLRDEKTSDPLPVACLPFLGKNLIELLIRDLIGREYLYFKLFKKRLITPVALMTSVEKNNDWHINKLLEEANWFDRPKETYKIFKQPLAPLVTKDGLWVVTSDWQLRKKPGGHGVIWKLAQDFGVFDWFLANHRTKGIVRQLNNPIAGIDHALVSFSGLGTVLDKKFGFLSCERTVNAQEGMDVLYEEKTSHGYVVGIVNVEYTDFVRKDIPDVPKEEGSNYSAFPSNTNILFIDFEQIGLAAKSNPFPGLVFNPKTKVDDYESAGRLESAMQNIADDFKDLLSKPLYKKDWQNLSVFIAYNERKKTISVAKKAYEEGGSSFETPMGAFHDLLANNVELLVSCKVDVPFFKAEEIDSKNPQINFLYHPALGPFYSVIAQKIEGGKIVPGGELYLEIAEFYWKDCTLLGSLLVEATSPIGSEKSDGCGKCYLEHVAIKNKGIDYSKSNAFWKRKIHRKESLRIRLEGNSFFYAKDVVLEGDKEIIVKDGKLLIATQVDGQLNFEERDLKDSKSLFEYTIGPDKKIELKLNRPKL